MTKRLALLCILATSAALAACGDAPLATAPAVPGARHTTVIDSVKRGPLIIGSDHAVGDTVQDGPIFVGGGYVQEVAGDTTSSARGPIFVGSGN